MEHKNTVLTAVVFSRKVAPPLF